MQKSLNEISEDDQKEVEQLSAVFFTPHDIAVIMQLNSASVKDAMNDEDSPFYQAFQRGRLQSEFDLRKSIVKMAKSGSSPAQTMALDLLNKSTLKMMGK